MAKKDDPSSIPLNELFRAVNAKDRKWFDRLNPAQQQKFSQWLYNRYMSIARSRESLMQMYYLLAANRISNVNLSTRKNHPKLTYLLFTTIPNTGAIADHQFIPAMKQYRSGDKEVVKKIKAIEQTDPLMKSEDIEQLAHMMSDEEFIEYLQDHGWTDKQINEYQ